MDREPVYAYSANRRDGLAWCKPGGKQQIACFTSTNETSGPAINAQVVQLRSTITNGMANFSYSLDGKQFVPFGDPV